MDPNSQVPQAQNTPVAGESNVPASPASEPTTPSSQEPTTPAQETQNPTPDPSNPQTDPQNPQNPEPQKPADSPQNEPDNSKPRPAERRIRKLVDENRALRDQLESAQVPQLPPQDQRLSDRFKDQDSINPEDLDKVGQEVANKAAQDAQARNDLSMKLLETKMQVREAHRDFEHDARELESVPELDPTSDKFIPGLEDRIGEAWREQAVKPNPYNPQLKVIDPSVRLKDVAEKQLGIVRAAYEAGQASVANGVASQQDNLAVNPADNEPRQERKFADLSLAEMEAELRAKGHDI